jgi:hypothetical protein
MSKLLVLAICLTAAASPRTRPSAPNPAMEIKRNCTRCHNTDVIRAQHLSRQEWDLELKKMESMGAKVNNRTALLDYLTRRYGPESTKSTKARQ